MVKWEQTRIAMAFEHSSLVAFVTRCIIAVESSPSNTCYPGPPSLHLNSPFELVPEGGYNI